MSRLRSTLWRPEPDPGIPLDTVGGVLRDGTSAGRD
jgi:hypothetical protein